MESRPAQYFFIVGETRTCGELKDSQQADGINLGLQFLNMRLVFFECLRLNPLYYFNIPSALQVLANAGQDAVPCWIAVGNNGEFFMPGLIERSRDRVGRKCSSSSTPVIFPALSKP